MNRALWALVLVAMVYFGFQARDQIDAVFLGAGKLTVSEGDNGAVVLRWRGKIEAPMEARLAEAYESHKDKARLFVVSLSSPGGTLDQGARVVRLLRRMGETHRVETLIDKRSVCASMCVPVYLQGQRRVASADARFMFHEVSFRESLSDDEVAVPQAAKGSATDEFFAKYFATAGVPDDWIATVRRAMTGGNDVWKTGRELAGENAGIVQDVVE